MPIQRNELHAQVVEAWIKKNDSLSSDELTALLMNGIVAVRQRALSTLSNVTVTAVIDRILHEYKEKVPILSEVQCSADGIRWNKFSDQISITNPVVIQAALQELLIELLNVFGKITAEIITKNLHKELTSVTNSIVPQQDQELTKPLSLGQARKNRDQK